MGINHGGSKITVAEKLLDGSDIITIKVTRNLPGANGWRNDDERYERLPFLLTEPCSQPT